MRRRLLRNRLAGWLRRWSIRVARAASALDSPAPELPAPVATAADGPPEHWLRLVAERAPELLVGQGIRVGTPRVPRPLPPMPRAVPSEVAPGPAPAPRSAVAPMPLRPPVTAGSTAVESAGGEATPMRGAVEPTVRPMPGPGPSPVSTVDRPKPGAPAFGSPPRSWRRLLSQLVVSRGAGLRRPAQAHAPVPPRATASPRSVRMTVSTGEPAVEGSRDPAPDRTVGWPANPYHHQPSASAPEPVPRADDRPSVRRAPGLTTRSFEGPDPRSFEGSGARRIEGFDTRRIEGLDTRWPAPPSGGPWPWPTQQHADRWPALPDDRPLWTPPPTAFTDARIRRLDDEQRGA